MKWKFSKVILLNTIITFFLFSCNLHQNKRDWNIILQPKSRFVLLIHFEGDNCISCLAPLTLIKDFENKLRNVEILLTGKSTENFWYIYNNLQLNVKYLSFQNFQELNLPYHTHTPFLYLINTEKKTILIMDELPKEERSFFLLLKFIQDYTNF